MRACVRACPRQLFERIPFRSERVAVVACANRDPGRAVRDVCRVGCIGCERCVRIRPDLFRIQDDLAAIDYERYTGEEDLEAVRAACPMKTLVLAGGPEKEVPLVHPPARAQRPTAADLEWRG